VFAHQTQLMIARYNYSSSRFFFEQLSAEISIKISWIAIQTRGEKKRQEIMSVAISSIVRGAVDYAMRFDLRVLHLSESSLKTTLWIVMLEKCYNVEWVSHKRVASFSCVCIAIKGKLWRGRFDVNFSWARNRVFGVWCVMDSFLNV
jgi:hypothetical protein